MKICQNIDKTTAVIHLVSRNIVRRRTYLCYAIEQFTHQFILNSVKFDAFQERIRFLRVVNKQLVPKLKYLVMPVKIGFLAIEILLMFEIHSCRIEI